MCALLACFWHRHPHGMLHVPFKDYSSAYWHGRKPTSSLLCWTHLHPLLHLSLSTHLLNASLLLCRNHGRGIAPATKSAHWSHLATITKYQLSLDFPSVVVISFTSFSVAVRQQGHGMVFVLGLLNFVAIRNQTPPYYPHYLTDSLFDFDFAI